MTLTEVYRLIPLTQGQFAKVSPYRFEELNRFKWQAMWNPPTKSYYAVRTIRAGGTRRLAFMHREIIGLAPKDKLQGDHINRITLDNTDANLRVASRSQQCQNRRKRATNTSGYKGVTKDPRSNSWRVCMIIDGKRRALGSRSSAEAAYRELYVPAALKHYGEFACLE